MVDEVEVEVTLIGGNAPTKVTLHKFDAGARNQALREAIKVRGNVSNMKNAQAEIDGVLLNEVMLVAAIKSPVELASLDAVRRKLYPGDFDKLFAAADELNSINPLPNTNSVPA